jgi:hypothetical protein
MRSRECWRLRARATDGTMAAGARHAALTAGRASHRLECNGAWLLTAVLREQRRGGLHQTATTGGVISRPRQRGGGAPGTRMQGTKAAASRSGGLGLQRQPSAAGEVPWRLGSIAVERAEARGREISGRVQGLAADRVPG